MTDALAILNPQTMDTLEKLASNISQSALIPDSLRGKPRDVLVVLMTGAELGIQPMQAIRGISVIKGKPALSADLLVSLVKQRRDICESLQLVKATPQGVTYRAKRVGEEPTEMSFTIEDAQRAGLTGSDMYRKWPLQMLRARCATLICRAVFPDVALGIYDVDSGELTDGKVVGEKEAAPTKGAEAVRAALAKPAEATVEATPRALPSDATVSLEALKAKADSLRKGLEAKPKAPNAKAARAKLAELDAEIAAAEAPSPPPPTDADWVPSEPPAEVELPTLGGQQP